MELGGLGVVTLNSFAWLTSPRLPWERTRAPFVQWEVMRPRSLHLAQEWLPNKVEILVAAITTSVTCSQLARILWCLLVRILWSNSITTKNTWALKLQVQSLCKRSFQKTQHNGGLRWLGPSLTTLLIDVKSYTSLFTKSFSAICHVHAAFSCATDPWSVAAPPKLCQRPAVHLSSNRSRDSCDLFTVHGILDILAHSRFVPLTEATQTNLAVQAPHCATFWVA